MGTPLNMELLLDGVVAVLLLVTVGYCLLLNRRLTALRGSQADMRQLLTDFADAARQAESSVHHLKTTGEHLSATLDQRMKEARALADELKLITQSGSRLADRIESGLVGGTGPDRRAAAPDHAPDAPAKLSESERELAELLRQAR